MGCTSLGAVRLPRLLVPPIACGLVALPLLTAPPAPAAPTVYAQVLSVYQATGTVAPCQFSSAQLQSALKGIDTYGAQYFSDFATAVQSALSQRASGACAPGAAGLLAHITPRNDVNPTPLAPVTAATSAGLPLPILLMALLSLAALLGVAAGAVWRRRGWQPAWALEWRHAWGEAGHRAGARWLDFDDWRRSGR